MSAGRPRAPRASARPPDQVPLPPAAAAVGAGGGGGPPGAAYPDQAAHPRGNTQNGAVPPGPQDDLPPDDDLVDPKDDQGYDDYDDYPDGTQMPPGMPYPGGAVSQLGPFANPLANKIVRGVSVLATLIAIILQFLIISQGVSSYMKAGSLKSKDKSSKTSEEDTSSSSPKKKEKSTKESKDDLLGRAISTVYETATPTARMVKRAIFKRAESARPTPAPSSLSYVPGGDVPDRDGAVGFTATGHLFAVLICMIIIYMDWLLLRSSPTVAGYWTPLIIAVIQLYLSLDILGRVISKAGEGGAYLLLLLAIFNTFIAGWTVLQARKNGPPPMYPYDDYPDEGPPPDGPEGLDATAEGEEGEPEPDAPPIDPKTGQPVPKTQIPEKGGRPRASSASFITDDIDSYYQRSPSTYKGPRQPMPRRYSQASALAVPQPAYYGGQATTPIDLYGPQEYQRRLEQQRRSRRQSLIQPTMQYDPVQGRYVQQAGTFGQRTFETVHEEDEEEEQVFPQALPANDPRISRDGFANRAREWKRLQRM